MGRATGRTSLVIGDQDVRDLLSAVDTKIGSLEIADVLRDFHYQPIPEAMLPSHGGARDELLRFYRLRNRVDQARARIDGERFGRSTGGAS